MTRLVVVAVLTVVCWWPVRAMAADDPAPVPSTEPVTVPTTEATVPVSTVPPALPPPSDPASHRHREAHRGARRLRRPYTASRSNVPVTATTLPAGTTTSTLGDLGLFVSPPPLAPTTTTGAVPGRRASRAAPVPTATITPVPVRWSRSDLAVVGVLIVVAVGAFAGAYRMRKVRP